MFAQTGNFANFLKENNFTRLIAISAETSRIVAAILLASQTLAQNFKDLLATLLKDYQGVFTLEKIARTPYLLLQVAAVTKNSAHF